MTVIIYEKRCTNGALLSRQDLRFLMSKEREEVQNINCMESVKKGGLVNKGEE